MEITGVTNVENIRNTMGDIPQMTRSGRVF